MLTQSYKTLIVTREETTSVPGVHFIICLDLFQSLLVFVEGDVTVRGSGVWRCGGECQSQGRCDFSIA